MAEYLSKTVRRVTIAALCVWGALASPVAAEVLLDPTRPPAFIGEKPEQGNDKASIAPELQSVLISPARRVAIINGQTVQLGEKYGEARVVKITENEVILRNGRDTQVLKLFPHVEKRLASSRANGKVEAGSK